MSFELDQDAVRTLVERELPGAADAADWSEIRNGDECRVFRLDGRAASTIVRVHPDRHDAERVRWTHRFVRHCHRSVPEVVAPLPFSSGDTVAMAAAHPVTAFPHVAGADLNPDNPALRTEAARVLARLHAAGVECTLPPPPGRPPASADEWVTPACIEDPDFDAWERGLPELGLLRLPTHGDYYPRNPLADGDRITGVIDWDEAQVDYRMAELAWAVWELCQDAAGEDFCHGRARELVRAYRELAPAFGHTELAQLVPFIRRRLKREIGYQLGVIERGGPWNDEHQAYLDAEIRAFAKLRESTWQESASDG